jgi:hypothetical protein
MPHRLTSARQMWRSWCNLPRLVRFLLLPSWCLLGCARLAILVLPFRLIAPALGVQTGTHSFSPLLAPAQTDNARAIGRSVELAARYTPWQSVCQPQALVARLWLGLFGVPYLINYGVCKDAQGKLQAHAWVVSGVVYVTGGNGYPSFTVVRTFVGPTRWARAFLPVS